MPFKPKHLRNFSEAELEALEKLNTGSSPTDKQAFSPMTPSKLGQGAEKTVDLDLLERKAEEGVNGHGHS